MTPEEVIADYIAAWEGGLSLHRLDNGNWTGGKVGIGAFVGSRYGVTAAALAKHRKLPPSQITAQAMAALTPGEAAAIGCSLYYDAPGLDRLAWNRVTASVLDFGWGAGPTRAIGALQRMIGTAIDGDPGPETAAGFDRFLSLWGEAGAARRWAAVRNSYYDAIVSGNSSQRTFLAGWKNRTAYFAPGGNWWRRWS